MTQAIPTYAEAMDKAAKGERAIKSTAPQGNKLTRSDKIAASLLFQQLGFPRAVVAAYFSIHPRTMSAMVSTTNNYYADIKQFIKNTPVDELVRDYITEEMYNKCVALIQKGVSARSLSQSSGRSLLKERVALTHDGGCEAVIVTVRSLQLPEWLTYGVPDVRKITKATVMTVWGYSVSDDVYGAGVDPEDDRATMDSIFICRKLLKSDTDPDMVRTGALFKSPKEAREDAERNYLFESRFARPKN